MVKLLFLLLFRFKWSNVCPVRTRSCL